MKKVKEGYKMTELGEIPSEWEVKKLKELLDVLKDGTHNPPKRTEEGIPLLSAENIFNGKINYGINEKCISEEDYELMHKNYSIEKDDILMTIVGTIGRVAVVKDNKKFTVQRSVAILRSNKKVNNLFLTQFLSSTICKKELDRKSNSTAQAGLYLGELGKINIIVPSIKEQEKIASILSTVDEQIDNVDALIEKNKELKKGLMQTLLTKGIGHTKFKKTEIGEIPEEWEVKNLSEVVWYQEGPGLRKWQFTSAGIKVINVTNLVGNYLDLSNTSRYIDESEVEKKYKHFLIDENDIVVASSGNSWGKVSVVRKRDLPLLMNTSVIRFKSMEEERLSTKYLLQFLKSDAFKKQIALLITGSAQPNFGPYHLDRTKIATPNINEQLKIASILSEADEKIKKYENKKQKLEELKKGLMQQLLTGKIRVI